MKIQKTIVRVFSIALFSLTTAGFIGAQPSRGLTAAPFDPEVAAPAEKLGKAYAMIAAHVGPAVVSVYSEKTVEFRSQESPSPFDDEFFQRFFREEIPQRPGPPSQEPFQMPQRGMGSGMIIDKEGRILTNYHVVREVDEIRVKLADNRSFEAEIVGKDPPSDIAVIQIKGEAPADLPTVQLGNSDELEVGSVVMAIGAPFGYVQTVTTGVISAKGRSGVGVNTYEDFLQTDAAINPGNSGGPLINMRGEVIGINAVIATRIGQFAGVGFAIPINMVKTLLPTLSKGETVTRGLLGVIIQEVTLDLAKQFGLEKTEGALVSQVNPGSPAEKAGIKAGDVIVRFGDRPVEDTSHLRNMVAATEPHTQVKIEIVRDGKPEPLNVTIGKLEPEDVATTEPSSDTGKNQLKNLGMEVQTLDSEFADQLGYENQKGAVVTSIQPGGPASVAGLARGDLIVEVNREPITTADELRQAFEKAKTSALVLFKRKDASRFVVLPIE